MTNNKRCLIVRKLDTGEEIKRIEIKQGSSNQRVERVLTGLLINMNTDDYYVDDSQAYLEDRKDDGK